MMIDIIINDEASYGGLVQLPSEARRFTESVEEPLSKGGGPRSQKNDSFKKIKKTAIQTHNN